ncbi:TPA: hypothetical protein N0F65_004953 [Lagenidium giganteum]|uniref:Protein FRA10AC1 n=1 Tax=Lagenidium giganteum TaxID=4803 RepID=A0AAV2YY47_9STRA|nr:TPA: hypothetical protein N0F65_004953 [Lagenidium giganteum]
MRTFREKARGKAASAVGPADLAVLKRNFQFIRDDEADASQSDDWQVRMSVRYYERLFREYALADLSRCEEGKLGLRWRTEMEVIQGKGQFSCGNKRCEETRSLHSYEVLFAYTEQGERKRCLVKLRMCEECARKLFHKKIQELATADKQVLKKQKKQKRKKETKKNEDEQEEEENSRRKRQRTDTDPSADASSVHAICAQLNANDIADVEITRDSAKSESKVDASLGELFV